MRIGAGIAGILLGLFSLSYVGIFGSVFGAGAGMFASGIRDDGLGSWSEMIVLLSWIAPLTALAGGIVTFSKPRIGGGILAASAGLHWYLLGLGMIGKLFVLPIAVTALLAFFSPGEEETSKAGRSSRNPIDNGNADRPKLVLGDAPNRVSALGKRVWQTETARQVIAGALVGTGLGLILDLLDVI